MELIQVYFRLDSPYKWGKGMSEDLYPPFRKEVEEILNKIGLTVIPEGIKLSVASPQGVCGKEGLYMHPMEFTGVLSRERFEKAKEVIENFDSKIFSLRDIEVFEMREYSWDTARRNEEKQAKIDALG